MPRLEHDFLGEMRIPSDTYYGIQTYRAVENFPIAGVSIASFPELIKALGLVKKASAIANMQFGVLPREIGDAICAACDEIIEGKLHDQFPVDCIQGGAGTSTNMNANEVIANRALELLGQYKVDVAEQRIHEIDPNIKVTTYKIFFTPETQDQFDFTQYDYVVDAIDTVTGKIALVVKAKEAGTPIICAMGAGNKMDPTRFEVTDIYKTSVCPLAKVMRTECRKRRIKHLKVVYSKEPAMTPIEDDSISCKNQCICPPGTQRKCTIRRSVPGSNAFVPSVAGLIIGGEVVKDLVGFVPMKG